MAKTFTTIVALQNFLQSACETAIENVAKRMTEELESYILEDFYRQYKPKIYDRTYRLLKSPTYNMLNNNSAKIYIDIESIHYLIDGSSSKYDTEDVIKLATLGYHGSIDIFRPGMFWEDFLNWCENNVTYLMKLELKKQGLTVI